MKNIEKKKKNKIICPEKEMDFENMWMCEKDIMDIRRRYRTHTSYNITVGLSLESSVSDYKIKLPI